MMKLYVPVSVLSLCLLVTACGTSQGVGGTTPPQSTGISNNTTNTSSSTTNSTSSTTTSSGQIQLTPFQPAENSGLSVKVPQGWTTSTFTGGDYSGWKLTDPNNSNNQVIVVGSTCVGCYTNAQNLSDPKLVIPEANANVLATGDNGNSVQYSFTKKNNSDTGLGKVIVSTDKSGYGYVEVLLPASEQVEASQILDSFAYTH